MKPTAPFAAALLALACAACSSTPPAAQQPLVQTRAGALQGTVQNGTQAFLGIPYAKAERFQAPAPAEAWTGTRQAQALGNICPQSAPKPQSIFLNGPELPESEDCLNLNVWTPAADGKKRAVMVWLHGGGFSTGSSGELDIYNGANLAKSQDVVVVSVNHRLNVLGHLDLSAYDARYAGSANAGIQDLVAALQWVKANIDKFGGNPDNITIFGESGGGAKVLTLMATPAADGLFHKAIVQSGAVERMGMTLTPAKASRRVAELTLKNLGLNQRDAAKLQTADYAQLVAAGDKAMQQTAEEMKLTHVMQNGTGLAWAPTLDGRYIPQEPVGNRYPAQAKNIPLLIGSNLTEWTTFPAILNPEAAARDSKNNWSAQTVRQKMQEKFGERAEAVQNAFAQAYPERKAADAYFVESFLRTPALKTARLKADQNGAPVYQYLFTWEPAAYGGAPMSYHTSEIAFVFDNTNKNPAYTGGSPEAPRLAKQISSAWANFAKTGTPSAQGLPAWPAYTRQNGAVMVLDKQSAVRRHHDEALMRLLAPDYAF